MPNTFFQFKEFLIHQDACAMKVGTDGVLLGAWAPVPSPCRAILDVGTGTGLVAMQLAQRVPEAQVTAVEVDEAAARQALQNVRQGPWADRMTVVCQDFVQYRSEVAYDLVACNPPYFVDALRSPEQGRDLARHADMLNYYSLFDGAASMLALGGIVAVIVPAECRTLAVDAAFRAGLYPASACVVRTKPGKPPKRCLLSFGHAPQPVAEDELCICDEDGAYTEGYRSLTVPFYLHF